MAMFNCNHGYSVNLLQCGRCVTMFKLKEHSVCIMVYVHALYITGQHRVENRCT